MPQELAMCRHGAVSWPKWFTGRDRWFGVVLLWWLFCFVFLAFKSPDSDSEALCEHSVPPPGHFFLYSPCSHCHCRKETLKAWALCLEVHLSSSLSPEPTMGKYTSPKTLTLLCHSWILVTGCHGLLCSSTRHSCHVCCWQEQNWGPNDSCTNEELDIKIILAPHRHPSLWILSKDSSVLILVLVLGKLSIAQLTTFYFIHAPVWVSQE